LQGDDFEQHNSITVLSAEHKADWQAGPKPPNGFINFDNNPFVNYKRTKGLWATTCYATCIRLSTKSLLVSLSRTDISIVEKKSEKKQNL
jgi:hypothetical protein